MEEEAPPVPVRAMVCGLPVALSVIVIVPAWVPVLVGVDVTLMVQLAPAPITVPQLFVWAYCPVIAIFEIFNCAVPESVSVTVWAALVVPCGWLPKFRVVGDTDADGVSAIFAMKAFKFPAASLED